VADYVVSWVDVMAYFTDCRERTILDLAEAEDDKAMWRAQGKLALLNELLNLQDIHATLEALGKP